MIETRKLQVFLCHSSQDKPIIRELYNRLLSEGWIDPWLDEEKLLPGQDWAFEIPNAVQNSDVILVCLSKGSVTKEGFIQKEISQALDIAEEKPDGTIFIVPLKLEDCLVPGRLRRWQWLDFYPKNKRVEKTNKLIQTLMMRVKQLGISLTIPSSNNKIKSFLDKILLDIQVNEDYLKNSTTALLSPFKTLQPGNSAASINGQRVFGSIIELLFLILFFYADAIQGAQNLALLFPETVIPPFLQDAYYFPLLMSSAGTMPVLGIMIGDLLSITNLTRWADLREWKKPLIAIMASTLIFSIVLSFLFLDRPDLIISSPENIGSNIALVAQSLLIIPLLITTAFLYGGTQGIFVLLALPLIVFRFILIGLRSIVAKVIYYGFS